MSGLHIGITIGLHAPDETLWNNGIKQNAVFLSDALRHCPGVASVTLLNATPVPITAALPWDLQRWPTRQLDDAINDIDLLIELGGQIDSGRTDYLKARGTRLVSYCCGFEYIHAVEGLLANRPMWGDQLFINQRYDDIWMIPQVAGNSQSFFEVLRRHPARVVPFVWSPVFLEMRAAHLPNGGRYLPRTGPARLTVMEPNINITKHCLYPTLIAELAYRARPDDIALLQVANTLPLATDNAAFIALMNQLDLVRNHKAVFAGRYDTPEYLSTNTDIVISHQLENPLNYFYLDVCWQGYPLVHNATLCSDLGYYYEGNDAALGAQQVLRALDHHDEDAPRYLANQRARIARYLPDNPALVATYRGLLDQLLSRPIR
jgi:hypothetical protein